MLVSLGILLDSDSDQGMGGSAHLESRSCTKVSKSCGANFL